MDTDNLQDLRDFARQSRIHNEDEYWCCQDFVWTLVEELEAEGLLEHCDDFERQRREIHELKGPHR